MTEEKHQSESQRALLDVDVMRQARRVIAWQLGLCAGGVAITAASWLKPVGSITYVLLAVIFGGLIVGVARSHRALRDIHDRLKELEAKARALESARAKGVNAAKLAALGAMAGGLAHEINNPLSIIKGYGVHLVKMIENDSLSTDILRHIAQKIETTSDRIARVIQGLKDFSKESSQTPIREESLASIVQSTLAFCRAKYESEGIKVEVVGSESDIRLSCRVAHVSQVVFALLSNAYDAVQRQPQRWIRISSSADADSVSVVVTDSGPGIPSHVVERLWEPFFTTKETGKGTGLGLSVARSLAENHGGELFLDPVAAHTSFVLRLPKAPPRELGLIQKSA